MKTCNVCNLTLALDLFSRRAASPDGFGYTCKACGSARNKFNYQNSKDRAKQRAKSWAIANPARRKAIANAYDSRNLAVKRLKNREYQAKLRKKDLHLARHIGRVNSHNRRGMANRAGKMDPVAARLILSAARGSCAYCWFMDIYERNHGR